MIDWIRQQRRQCIEREIERLMTEAERLRWAARAETDPEVQARAYQLAAAALRQAKGLAERTNESE